MKIFICNDFVGHYPVGTAAVVVAQNKTHAENLLDAELARCGLSTIGRRTVKELKTDRERAVILCDGNY